MNVTFARTLHPRRCRGRSSLYVSAWYSCGLPPHVLHQNVYGRAIHVVTRCSSHSKGVHRVLLILHTCRPMGLEVGGHLRRRQRQLPLLPAI